MSTALYYDLSELVEAAKKIGRIGEFNSAQLLDEVGFLLSEQTRDRLINEKTSPDGDAWPAWSPAYAATRGSNHSLLIGEGSAGLEGSIQHVVDGDAVEVGSNLVYAAIHQFGGAEVGKNIPARAYLGLSDENTAELHQLVIDHFDEHIKRVWL